MMALQFRGISLKLALPVFPLITSFDPDSLLVTALVVGYLVHGLSCSFTGHFEQFAPVVLPVFSSCIGKFPLKD